MTLNGQKCHCLTKDDVETVSRLTVVDFTLQFSPPFGQ